MARFPFLDSLGDPPRPFDAERAADVLADLTEAGARQGGEPLESFVRGFCAEPRGRQLLEAVVGNSPFLAQALLRNPQALRKLAEQEPQATFAEICASVEAAWRDSAGVDDLMSRLRTARLGAAVTAALADVGGAWSLEDVTTALSAFADAAIGAATRHQLAAAAAAGNLELSDPNDPAMGSGFFVLAVGKLGSRELNYSSDVDLIALWDPERASPAPGAEPHDLFVRLTREIVRILSQVTADGYVFRVDLRLRPDPGATPVAMSTLAAETYYESVGQNWERAALIRARAMAGDREAGAAFRKALVPFLWRKHLDFAAIDDIHSIKRQIHAHKGHARVEVRGHDIKLGAGGIRDIEFFAQTQQLIAGGRDPRLRVPDTPGALRALSEAGVIEDDAASELIAAYRFLRTLEHRLQMIADEQTHTVPADDRAFERVATFAGFADSTAFTAALRDHLDIVAGHSARLFEHAPPLSSAGNLVFTGGGDDPATLKTLERLGFPDPPRAARLVRGWHHGRYRATRTARARALLTELAPTLLEAFGRTPAPGTALLHLDEFLSRLPAGVQLFSLFVAHPELLDLLAEVMGTAPKLAEHLALTPTLLDSVLEPEFYDPPPGAEALQSELEAALSPSETFEQNLDAARRWAKDRRFQVGVQVMRGRLGPVESGHALTRIADVLIQALLPRTAAEVDAAHGAIDGSAFAVLAMGKLGARELTSGSDLDLIFLYRSAGPGAESTGPRPLAESQYFARLAQRLLAALTAPTAEGTLFEVDMRLRPSGAAGPIAIGFEAFLRYQREVAWTWEHQALTRARIVAGDDALASEAIDGIRAILASPRDPDHLLRDVAEMRARIDRDKGSTNLWRVKYVRGGLVDLEFLGQYLALRGAAEHPDLPTGDTAETFRRLGASGALEPDEAAELARATLLLRGIQGFLRECYVDDLREEDASDALTRALARAAGAGSFAELRDRLAAIEASVYHRFQRHVEEPAAALVPVGDDEDHRAIL